MSDDDDFEEEPEDLDEEDLEEFDDDDLDDEAEVVDEELEEDLDEDAEVVEEADDDDDAPVPAVEDDEDIVDLDEELHPDDVEEALDVVLRERTAKAGLEDEDDEEEPDDRGETGTKIVPRRPGEFVCSSCFLVLPRHMLADEKAMLCRDCA
jgi:hypothetical protein